ncbi:MAG: sigma-70 family RNA polymerase sigma factor [Acidimicrobiia bacterium]|nr:sigma-70 family RNA polymerase sigma factor [Acidimicrobiia bacterium]
MSGVGVAPPPTPRGHLGATVITRRIAPEARSHRGVALLEPVAADTTDHGVADRLVAGDEAALRESYRAYAPAVYGLAVRVLSDEVLAQDVTQDVFVRLWERPERFDPARGTLRTFLLTMTHGRAVEKVRSEEAMRRRHLADAGRTPPAPETDPAGLVDELAAAREVRGALGDLPSNERIPIELAYFEGLSYRDVAIRLDEPEGTVKYRIRKGMQKMRAALRSMEVTP